MPENGTAFRAVLQRVDDGSGPAFSVRVQGRGGVGAASTRSISAVVESGGGAFLPFEWALFGHKDLTIENNGTLDGSVGANGFIDFVGGATVTGDAQAGDSIVGNTSGVAGSVTENAPWSDSLPRIPCPPAPFGPVPGGGANVSFNASNGNITISGGGDAIFTSGVYHFNNFTKKGDGSLLIPPGETVIIFIQGLVSFSGAGHTNPPPAQPAQLQMYGCGQKAANWTFAGGGSVRHLVAYAPRGVMTLRNDAIVFGSFIGDKVKKENDGDVTYDPSVASIMPPGWSGGGGGAAKMIKRTWTEF